VLATYNASVTNNPLRNLFDFLFTRGQNKELITEYVIREHHRGRSLAEILEDPHVVNTCSPEEIRDLLDDPAIVHAVGEDLIAAQRSDV
jgi:hypothetical protein